jgi:hypothetical protein
LTTRAAPAYVAGVRPDLDGGCRGLAEGPRRRERLEAVGLDSSRSRPPTRDIRPLFRDKVRAYVHRVGAPHADS